jgi:ASC-1-like (ASCH) protein
MKGMNSHTFNYLENNKDVLQVDKSIPVLDYKGGSTNEADARSESVRFFSDCVRLNRPCKLKQAAHDWVALRKWTENNGGAEYLKERLPDVQIYDSFKSLSKRDPVESFHFSNDNMKWKNYEVFLEQFKTDPKYTTMRLKVDNLHPLMQDFHLPEYIHDVEAVENMTIFQGQDFYDKPRFTDQERLVCIIEGAAEVHIVPSVYRQELYEG